MLNPVRRLNCIYKLFARIYLELNNIYITFDLDVFDSSLIPATGTPEPGGLDWKQVTSLLRKVAATKNIIGCDVVELMPRPDFHACDFLAAKILQKILTYTFSQRSL